MSKQEILELLDKGKSPRQIAAELGVSTQYVYQIKNPEKIDKAKKYAIQRRWVERNREHVNAYHREYNKRRKGTK